MDEAKPNFNGNDATPDYMKKELKRADDIIGHNVSGLESVRADSLPNTYIDEVMKEFKAKYISTKDGKEGEWTFDQMFNNHELGQAIALSKNFSGDKHREANELFREYVKSFIRQALTKLETEKNEEIAGLIAKLKNEVPMGVSQWKEHGIKYGYWDYFKNAQQAEFVQSLEGILDNPDFIIDNWSGIGYKFFDDKINNLILKYKK